MKSHLGMRFSAVYCVLLGCCGNTNAELPEFAPWPMQGRNLVHTSNGLVAAANNSLLVLNFMTGGAVYSFPVVAADGTVYVGSGDENLYAVDGSNGSHKWNFTTGGAVSSSPAVGADGTVYVGSGDENLYAFDGSSGNLKWNFTTGGVVAFSPAVGADGTIYFGSYDGNLYGIVASASVMASAANIN